MRFNNGFGLDVGLDSFTCTMLANVLTVRQDRAPIHNIRRHLDANPILGISTSGSTLRRLELLTSLHICISNILCIDAVHSTATYQFQQTACTIPGDVDQRLCSSIRISLQYSLDDEFCDQYLGIEHAQWSCSQRQRGRTCSRTMDGRHSILFGCIEWLGYSSLVGTIWRGCIRSHHNVVACGRRRNQRII